MFVGAEKPRKLAEYREARWLRSTKGMPIKQIASRLDVSPATVHRWTVDIELTPAQRKHNLGRGRPGQPSWLLTRGRARKARALRRGYQSQGRDRARQGDPIHLGGCMLYWAEGAKHRNTAKLVNSDVQMVRFFVKFVRTCFDVTANDLSVTLNVYTGNGLTIEQIERHWLDALDLPRSCLRKHSINAMPTSSSG